MTTIQIKQSTASRSRDIRAFQEKKDLPVKEVRIRWDSVITICVERQRKVQGIDMASIEFGLASGNYFQCWITNEDVPVLMKKWDNELKLKGVSNMDLFSLGNKPLTYLKEVANSLVKIASILERVEKLLEQQYKKND